MKEGTGNRLQLVDFAKGFAIITIVFVHIFVLVPTDDPGTASSTPVTEFMYSGLMLFFIFAGYFYKSDRTPMQNIKRRAIQLLGTFIIAGFVLNLLMAGYLAARGYSIDFGEVFTEIFKGMFCLPFAEADVDAAVYDVNNGWYFLPVLFFGLVIFYPIADKVSNSWKFAAVSVAVLLVIAALFNYFIPFKLPFRFELAPMAAVFIIVGVYAKKYKVFDYIENEWRTPKYWIILVLVFIIGLLCATFIPTLTGFNVSRYGEYKGWSAFTFFFSSLFYVYFMLFVCLVLSKIPLIGRTVIYIGKFTLPILILHTFYIKLIASLFYELPEGSYFPSMPPGVTVVVGLVSIALSIITAYAVYKVLNEIKNHRRDKQAVSDTA